MSDDTPIDEAIAGTIAPPADGEGAPIFEVIGRREDFKLHTIGIPNVRPCDHTSGTLTYVLDEKFQTVTCSKCKTQIPAFSVLMLYADWNERHRSDRELARRAEHQLSLTRLRYLGRLKGPTDEEQREIAKGIRDCYKLSPRALGAIVDRIEDAIAARKAATERKRNPVKGNLPPTKIYHA